MSLRAQQEVFRFLLAALVAQISDSHVNIEDLLYPLLPRTDVNGSTIAIFSTFRFWQAVTQDDRKGLLSTCLPVAQGIRQIVHKIRQVGTNALPERHCLTDIIHVGQIDK